MKQSRPSLILYALIILMGVALYAPAIGFAQTPPTYTPLVGIPGLQTGTGDLATYFNRLYMITIGLGAILAFLKIAMAGVKYSLSGLISDKADAKRDIQGALLGLAILLIPFIVLNTIYPQFTNLNILQNSNLQINAQQSTANTGGGGSGACPAGQTAC